MGTDLFDLFVKMGGIYCAPHLGRSARAARAAGAAGAVRAVRAAGAAGAAPSHLRTPKLLCPIGSTATVGAIK